MKIKEYGSQMRTNENDDVIVNIFAVYWFGNNETYFLGFPEKYGGLISYRADEVEVVDPTISFRTTLFHNSSGGYGIFHWALIEKCLLDDLLELDETAYQNFLAIIKSEDLVSEDFY